MLPGGGSLSFSLSVPINQLSLIIPGVYPIQIAVVGDIDGVPTDLAQVGTFLPYVPMTGSTATAATSTPTPLAWLVSLTASPSLLADGALVSDSTGDARETASPLLREVAPSGRLRHLLDAITAPGVRATATIDPAVVRSLALAGGASFELSDGAGSDPVTQPAAAVAKDWLADLRAASGVDLVALPYADADIEALLHNGHEPLADIARTRGEEVLRSGVGAGAAGPSEVTLTSGVAVPPGGHVDRAGASYYATAVGSSPKADTLVLAPDSVPGTGDNPSAAASVPGIDEQVLLSDDVLSALVTRGPGSNARLAEQEIIAELAEAHLEDTFTSSPSSAGTVHTPQPLLIRPAAGWDPGAGWLRALLNDTRRLPWLDQVQVADLTTAAPEPRAALQYSDAARRRRAVELRRRQRRPDRDGDRRALPRAAQGRPGRAAQPPEHHPAHSGRRARGGVQQLPDGADRPEFRADLPGQRSGRVRRAAGSRSEWSRALR